MAKFFDLDDAPIANLPHVSVQLGETATIDFKVAGETTKTLKASAAAGFTVEGRLYALGGAWTDLETGLSLAAAVSEKERVTVRITRTADTVEQLTFRLV